MCTKTCHCMMMDVKLNQTAYSVASSSVSSEDSSVAGAGALT